MSDTQIAIHRPLVKASTELSQSLGMEVPMMIDAMKSQCFKGKRPDEVTDAQLATYISTANALKLNPLLPGQMYAYPDRQGGGVTVMIGPDGVFTLLSNNPDIVAQKDGGPAWWTEHGKDGDKDTCTGYINHRTKGLIKKTIWVDEWVVSSNPNWQTRRHHQSEIRAIKQTARMIIHGMPMDSDEHKLGEMLNVTDSVPDANPQGQQQAAERPAPPPRARKGASAVPDKSAQPHMEAEIVPPKPEPAQQTAAPTEPAKSVEPVTETPASTARPDNPKLPRAFLKDKEEINAVCTVEALTPLWAGKKLEEDGPQGKKGDKIRNPSVQAKVIGDFVGLVLHVGGASPGAKPEDDPVPAPEWKVGGKVALTLLGKAQKDGTVRVFVNSIKAEGSPDTAMDVD